MGTEKLAAIWRLLTSQHSMVFTIRHGKVDSVGFGNGPISEIMGMAIEMKRSYNGLIEIIDEMSVEAGELHAVQEMKKALEAMETK